MDASNQSKPDLSEVAREAALAGLDGAGRGLLIGVIILFLIPLAVGLSLHEVHEKFSPGVILLLLFGVPFGVRSFRGSLTLPVIR